MKKILTGALIMLVGVFMLSVPNVLAQDFCKGLADYDSDVDADDVVEFLNHFGRFQFNNPCPPDGPAPVGKTGQLTSYGTGDDGDLEKGVEWPNPRFTDNGDGTITDKLTGLLWLKNANCFEVRTWDQALLDCNGLATGLCGLTDGSIPGDWRLPNIDELLSLIDRSQISPALPLGNPFTGLEASQYWSSTTSVYDTSYAWYVWLDDGFSDFDFKIDGGYLWPVKGGH